MPCNYSAEYKVKPADDKSNRTNLTETALVEAEEQLTEIIHLFPQEVTITVRVGISNFANVKSEQFQAVCQYPTQPVSTLPIKIMHNNSYITQMRTSIRDVEYIIER